mmetsp:Transcript_15074/g.19933  ORF Transcript_15074/g.19933 Transcript_15074/m.19933 type:complete len:360 (+) Transcript_15074:118-1197(+)
MSMVKTEAYVVKAQGEDLVKEEIELPELKATELELDMICCGLCHTDIHMRDNDWGVANYPLVPGHEGIGIVRAIGSAVKTHKVGDKVSVAWIRDSCLDCDSCACGRENICQKGYQGTYLASNAGIFGKEACNTFGCFSKIMHVSARFCVKIPEGIPDEIAAPLACGGGTVFEPIMTHCQPGTKLGIAGIGGLGTAAIKLAKLRGVVPIAISSSPGKKQAALAAGCSDFLVINDDADVEKWAGKIDVILDTTPVNTQPVAKYMGLLKFDGVYCRVGVPPASDQKFSFDFLPLIFTQKTICGSIVTGTYRLDKMYKLVADNLDFILADNPDMQQVEKVPFDQVSFFPLFEYSNILARSMML